VQSPPARRLLSALALAALAALAPSRAAAVEAPSGLVFSGGIGGGAELGLAGEKAAVAEAEFIAGWEHEPSGVRPELGVGLGLAPDGHLALRPGIRWLVPELPVQLRLAADWSTARDHKAWRWILVGAALELRWTSAFSLFVGADLGFPLNADAGLPLLIRGGASFRL
jgi:hypothetical protein